MFLSYLLCLVTLFDVVISLLYCRRVSSSYHYYFFFLFLCPHTNSVILKPPFVSVPNVTTNTKMRGGRRVVYTTSTVYFSTMLEATKIDSLSTHPHSSPFATTPVPIWCIYFFILLVLQIYVETSSTLLCSEPKSRSPP